MTPMSDRDAVQKLRLATEEYGRVLLECAAALETGAEPWRSRLTQLRDEMRRNYTDVYMEESILRWVDALDQILSGGPQGR
jgi:hypothetical protein